jgi:hypothetical protein
MLVQEKYIEYSKALNETLRQMFLLELESFLNPMFRNFVFQNFSRFKGLELLKKIHDYAFSNFKYIDEQGEVLISPKHMINIKAGDCDDFSLFVKTALRVLGINTTYLLAGKYENEFTHILVITPAGVLIDATNDKFNFLPSDYKHKSIVQELN